MASIDEHARASMPEKAASEHVEDTRNVDDDDEYTPAEQRKIIHKVDRRLLPVLGLMQAVSFLDRANMSNASVAGMTQELGLGVGHRYSIVLLVFFAPYVLLQFPASVLVRRVGPRVFLSSIVLAWGVVMLCFGFVQDWRSLIPVRMLLGAFEAGCFPGQYYLISSWYTRYDLYKRISIFYLIGVLGSALGGVLGLGFSQMDGVAEYLGWRWIFIMEGLLTCLVGILGYIFTVDFPDTAHRAWGFLTEGEAACIVRRINRDRQDADPERFSLRRFLAPAADFKIWLFAMMFLSSTMQAYAVGNFLPLILRGEMGFSLTKTQGLTTPPYLAAMVLMYVEGWLSDKFRLRAPVMYFNALLCTMGLCLMSWGTSPGAQYFGAICLTAGCSAIIPTLMVYQSNNIRGTWKRAFSSASLISFGGTGGIVGSLVFRSQDAPQYLPGIYACLAANAIIVIVVTALTVYFIAQNRRAEAGLVVLEDLPGFRYAL